MLNRSSIITHVLFNPCIINIIKMIKFNNKARVKKYIYINIHLRITTIVAEELEGTLYIH